MQGFLVTGFGDCGGDELQRVAALLAAGLQDRLDRLHEPASGGALSAVGDLSQDQQGTNRSFRCVIGGLDAQTPTTLRVES